MNNNKTLILGLGNDILTDDGIGPMLVNDLAQLINKPCIDFETACCGGLEIMEYIKGYRRVIFIDAIRTLNAKPGDVHYFVPSDFQETSNLSNLHDVNFITALKLGDTLDLDLPSDLHVIAVEIIEDMEFSTQLTSPLQQRYPEILKNVLALISSISGC